MTEQAKCDYSNVIRILRRTIEVLTPNVWCKYRSFLFKNVYGKNTCKMCAHGGIDFSGIGAVSDAVLCFIMSWTELCDGTPTAVEAAAERACAPSAVSAGGRADWIYRQSYQWPSYVSELDTHVAHFYASCAGLTFSKNDCPLTTLSDVHKLLSDAIRLVELDHPEVLAMAKKKATGKPFSKTNQPSPEVRKRAYRKRMLAVFNNRLLRLADLVESKEGSNEWDFGSWGKRVPCRTTYCALGWGTTMPNLRKAGLRGKWRMYGELRMYDELYIQCGTDVAQFAACNVFGLTKKEANDIFIKGRLSDFTASEDCRAAEWADMVRKYALNRISLTDYWSEVDHPSGGY